MITYIRDRLSISIHQRSLITFVATLCCTAVIFWISSQTMPVAQALADDIYVRRHTSTQTYDGFDPSIHYFSVDQAQGIETIGYCMNMGRMNGEIEHYNAGWEYAQGILAWIAYHGYPNSTVIGGKQLSEQGARTATAIAVYMAQGYIQPQEQCSVNPGALDNGGGGFSLSSIGPTNAEVRKAALALYQEACAHQHEDGIWNHDAVRIYKAPHQGVQNMLIVQKYVELTIQKTSSEEHISSQSTYYQLTGAEFEIIRSRDSKILARLTSNAEGRASVLVPSYEQLEIREAKAPQGFLLSQETHLVQTKDKALSITIANIPQKARLELHKADRTTQGHAQKGLTLAGAQFEIRTDSGQTYQATSTDQGSVVFESIPLGTITLKELQSPAGYQLSEETRTLHIHPHNTQEALTSIQLSEAFYNTPRAFNIEIAKFIEDEHKDSLKRPGIGIHFELISNSSHEKIATLTTNEQGFCNTSWDSSTWYGQGNRTPDIHGAIPFDPQGYTVKEVSTYAAYLPAETWTIAPDQQVDGATLRYIVENQKKASRLTVIKRDADTHEPIQNSPISFQLYDHEGKLVVQHLKYPSDREISTFTTDDRGICQLPESLAYGTYTLKEVTAHSPYMPDQTLTFQVNEDSPAHITLYLENHARTGTIIIKKLNAVSKIPCKGAEFALIAYDDMHIPYRNYHLDKGSEIARATTDETGTARFEHVELSNRETRYSIRETRAPLGYSIDHREKMVVFPQDISEAALTQEIIWENTPVTLKIHKQAEDNPSIPLAGVTFACWNETHIASDTEEGHASQEGSTYIEQTTNDTGEALFTHLTPGHWYLLETYAPEGIIRDQTRYEFDVLPDGSLAAPWIDANEATISNKRTQVAISKFIAETETLLPGAELALIQPNGERYASWISTETPQVFYGLEKGLWTLRELSAPEGYLKADDLSFDVMPHSEAQHVSLYNKPLPLEGDIDKRFYPFSLRDAEQKDRQHLLYCIDAQNMSSLTIDDAEIVERPALLTHGQAHLKGIVTPAVTGDIDGICSVWYQTDQDDIQSWHLWKHNIPTDTPMMLLEETQEEPAPGAITGIAFRFGKVDTTWTSRSDLWNRADIHSEHDRFTPNILPNAEGQIEQTQQAILESLARKSGASEHMTQGIYLLFELNERQTIYENSVELHLRRNRSDTEDYIIRQDRVVHRLSGKPLPLPHTGESDPQDVPQGSFLTWLIYPFLRYTESIRL